MNGARFLALLCLVMATRWMAVAAAADAPAQAGGAGEAAELTEAQKARAVEFMSSPIASRRQGAYQAGRRLGEGGREVYREILLRAQTHHRSRLETALERAGRGDDLGARLEALAEARAETMAFLRTDHDKDPGRIRELDRMYAGVETALRRVEAAVGRRDGGGLDDTLAVLAEIWVELAWCDGRSITTEDALEEGREQALPEDVLARESGEEKVLEATAALEAAHEHNSAQRWASRQQVEFARILNTARHVMGLAPLRLDERLSEAARGHSEEMRRMGYFAHESPVADHRTPAQRVRNADFEGSFAGENIYANSGGGRPQSAYDGWWASDGHRFIMFADGPDTLGLGISGGATHWTMKTGRKSER